MAWSTGTNGSGIACAASREPTKYTNSPGPAVWMASAATIGSPRSCWSRSTPEDVRSRLLHPVGEVQEASAFLDGAGAGDDGEALADPDVADGDDRGGVAVTTCKQRSSVALDDFLDAGKRLQGAGLAVAEKGDEVRPHGLGVKPSIARRGQNRVAFYRSLVFATEEQHMRWKPLPIEGQKRIRQG